MIRRAAFALLAAGLLFAGCASEPTRLPLGTPRDQALQQLGQPTATYPLAAGAQRLQYSRQPAGFEVNNVDIDGQGRVVAVTQALDERLFPAAIQIDAWRVPDVLREYGRPMEIRQVGNFEGDVWTWRYKVINSVRLLHIYIDPTGVVRRWHSADELREVLKW